jgi:hypothetical protein
MAADNSKQEWLAQHGRALGSAPSYDGPGLIYLWVSH